jgi:cytochrome bd-type quinol oxidase subunit 1
VNLEIHIRIEKLEALMAAIDDLTTQVAATDGVIASAVAAINGLVAALAAAGTDPRKLAALQDDLKSHSDALAAAIATVPPAP